ncbi:MAG: hypothetical protein AAFY33_18005, partial [Cyanobacteria bacterium J06643_4]
QSVESYKAQSYKKKPKVQLVSLGFRLYLIDDLDDLASHRHDLNCFMKERSLSLAAAYAIQQKATQQKQ